MNSSDWQTWAALSVVAATIAIFVRRLFFTKRAGGCGHHCGCAVKPALPSGGGAQEVSRPTPRPPASNPPA
jgi:hypothetical protein